MNPDITRGGCSFKGAFQYYLHDHGTDTRERIAWTETENMLTGDPDKAWKVMAYTATHQDRLKMASGQNPSGRKLEKPVMAYSLNWHPEQDPSRDHMLDVARQSMVVLGLQEHEAIIVAHRDTPHRHVHVMVNRVHPVTGMVASNSNSKRKLQNYARVYAKEHGLTYSPMREENAQKREAGEPTPKVDQNMQDAWRQSDSGKGLIAALDERGFKGAQGRKARFVVVDRYGDIKNPVRLIPGIRTKDMHERLRDVDVSTLPDADALAKQRRTEHAQQKPEKSRQAALDRAPDLKQKVEKAVGQETPKPKLKLAFDQARERDRQLGEKIGEKLANLQSRQLDERGKLAQKHALRLTRLKEELSAFYQLPEQRDKITALQEKCRNPSIWRRLFGQARRDRQELIDTTKSFRNAQMRCKERMDSLKVQNTAEMNMLKSRQQLVRTNANQRLFRDRGRIIGHYADARMSERNDNSEKLYTQRGR